jgi:hypothetical protein
MWRKLGFEIDDTKPDIAATLTVAGKIVVRTRRSHGSGPLPGMIGTFIRQQMKMNEGQFRDAVNCPLTAQGYLTILRQKGLTAE